MASGSEDEGCARLGEVGSGVVELGGGQFGGVCKEKGEGGDGGKAKTTATGGTI